MLRKQLKYCSIKWEVGCGKWEVKKVSLLRKLLFTSYFLLLISYFSVGCAPKVAPPPQYIKEELSLDEVIKKAGGDIEVLKAIADIRIEKNNELYDFINASVLVKKPDWVHMRIYKFGMLVRDFMIKDGELYSLVGNTDSKLRNVANEFLRSIFWWEDLNNGSMHREGGEYIIRAENKEIHLDSATLLPLTQDIMLPDKSIHIKYSGPVNNEGFWYPSQLEIFMGNFRFDVKLVKLIKNPPLGENDFRTPLGDK